MNRIGALIAFMLCATATASPPIERNWSLVKIESDSITVEIRTDARVRRIEMLSVVQDGKAVAIPDAVYRQVETPQINKLRIVACASTEHGTCSVLHLPFIDQGDDVPIEDAFKELVIELVEGRMVGHGIYSAEADV
jgi:hypothetical protein